MSDLDLATQIIAEQRRELESLRRDLAASVRREREVVQLIMESHEGWKRVAALAEGTMTRGGTDSE